MSQNGEDLSGRINFETNKMLADYIGNLVIGQMSAAAQAKVLGERAQQAEQQNVELLERFTEYETDIANLKAEIAAHAADDKADRLADMATVEAPTERGE